MSINGYHSPLNQITCCALDNSIYSLIPPTCKNCRHNVLPISTCLSAAATFSFDVENRSGRGRHLPKRVRTQPSLYAEAEKAVQVRSWVLLSYWWALLFVALIQRSTDGKFEKKRSTNTLARAKDIFISVASELGPN